MRAGQADDSRSGDRGKVAICHDGYAGRIRGVRVLTDCPQIEPPVRTEQEDRERGNQQERHISHDGLPKEYGPQDWQIGEQRKRHGVEDLAWWNTNQLPSQIAREACSKNVEGKTGDYLIAAEAYGHAGVDRARASRDKRCRNDSVPGITGTRAAPECGEGGD